MEFSKRLDAVWYGNSTGCIPQGGGECIEEYLLEEPVLGFKGIIVVEYPEDGSRRWQFTSDCDVESQFYMGIIKFDETF